MPTTPVKICLIQDYLPPYRIPLFAKVAEADDADFTLLLTARKHNNYEQWNKLTETLPFDCVSVPGLRFRFRSEMESGLNPALFGALVRIRPEVVICSGFSLNTILALVYKLLFRKRVVVWTEATETSESFLSYPKARTRVRRLLTRWVDGFIDAGTEAREYAASLLGGNRRVPFFRSYNAVDNEGFSRRCAAFRADANAFAAFKSRFPGRNILFSGQLIERKNIRRLIEVYEAILERSDSPVGLIILGQGPLEEYLTDSKRSRNLEHLYLEGFQLADNYFKYFAAADVFMLLSVYDCNPLVIFEALAAGLPSICTETAGNAMDFITEGQNGFIVAPDDVEGIAAKTLTILNDSDRQSIAEASREAVGKANYEDAAQAFLDAVGAVMRR